MSSVDQLISFQLRNLRQILLKFYLLRKANIDLLNDYLENLIDSYIIYLHPIKINLFWSLIPILMISEIDGSNEIGL